MSTVTRARSALAVLGRAVSELLVLPIRAYQLVISPLIGPTCRFYPSCSAYAIDALRMRGPLVGPVLIVRRLARCHPWNPGGVDPVPPRRRDLDSSARAATDSHIVPVPRT